MSKNSSTNGLGPTIISNRELTMLSSPFLMGPALAILLVQILGQSHVTAQTQILALAFGFVMAAIVALGLLALRGLEESRVRVAMDRLAADRKRFVVAAANQLGVPLSPINLQLHLLLDESLNSLTPAHRQRLEALRRNVESLNGLVDALRSALEDEDLQAAAAVLEGKRPVALKAAKPTNAVPTGAAR